MHRLTESTLTKRMHTAHLHDVIAPRQRIITEIEVLFFDKEQIHHGDEPYTYTNLTKPNLCSEYVLGQCVSLIKSTRWLFIETKLMNNNLRWMCMLREKWPGSQNLYIVMSPSVQTWFFFVYFFKVFNLNLLTFVLPDEPLRTFRFPGRGRSWSATASRRRSPGTPSPESLQSEIYKWMDDTRRGSIAQWLAYLLPNPAAPGSIPKISEIFFTGKKLSMLLK